MRSRQRLTARVCWRGSRGVLLGTLLQADARCNSESVGVMTSCARWRKHARHPPPPPAHRHRTPCVSCKLIRTRREQGARVTAHTERHSQPRQILTCGSKVTGKIALSHKSWGTVIGTVPMNQKKQKTFSVSCARPLCAIVLNSTNFKVQSCYFLVLSWQSGHWLDT